MSIENFLFKKLKQLFIFSFITILLILIMYAESDPTDKDDCGYLNKLFNDKCPKPDITTNVQNPLVDKKIGGSVVDTKNCATIKEDDIMYDLVHSYCFTNEIQPSFFNNMLLTYKLLLTIINKSNIDSLMVFSKILNKNTDNTMLNNNYMYKIGIIFLYLLIYYSYTIGSQLNNSFMKSGKSKNVNNRKITIKKIFLNSLSSFSLFIIMFVISLNTVLYSSNIIYGIVNNKRLNMFFIIQLFLLILGGGLTVISNMTNFKENMKNKNSNKKSNKNSNKNSNKSTKYLNLLFLVVLIIPIFTGLKLCGTIIYRGINGIINGTQSHEIKLFLSATIIMLLVMFIIEYITEFNIDLKLK
jgi:hypothetical protein